MSPSAAPLVADIGRTSATPRRALAVTARRWRAVATFRQLEAQRARHRIRFGEAERQPLTDAVGLPGLVADQRLGRLVVAEIFAAEVLREQQAVAAQVLD